MDKKLFTDWSEAPTADLVYMIKTSYHGYLLRELPVIGKKITKIYHDHNAEYPNLTDVYQFYYKLKSELEYHMQKEKDMVFPQIIAYEKQPSEAKKQHVSELINQLETEHGLDKQLLKQLRTATNDYQCADAPNDFYQETINALKELETTLIELFDLEDNILFSRFTN